MLATHQATLEFTKDKDLTKMGDCIVGVNADFNVPKEMIKAKKIKVTVTCGGISDYITSDVNQGFSDGHEIVIRKSGFLSKRTLGINADKAAIDIDRRIIEKLKNPDNFAMVNIEVLD